MNIPTSEDNVLLLIQTVDESIGTAQTALQSDLSQTERDQFEDELVNLKGLKLSLVQGMVIDHITKSINLYFEEGQEHEDAPWTISVQDRIEDFYLYMSHKMDEE